jgi:hypothetical protein
MTFEEMSVQFAALFCLPARRETSERLIVQMLETAYTRGQVDGAKALHDRLEKAAGL